MHGKDPGWMDGSPRRPVDEPPRVVGRARRRSGPICWRTRMVLAALMLDLACCLSASYLPRADTPPSARARLAPVAPAEIVDIAEVAAANFAEGAVPPEGVERPPVQVGLPTSMPTLSSADLWDTLRDETAHLDANAAALVAASLDVLLAKAEIAVRAELASPAALSRLALEPLPPRSRAAELLLILASVRTAKDLLKLRCDATTVVAAMLAAVMPERAPTWPACALPPEFMLQVSNLLEQQRRLRALGTGVGAGVGASSVDLRSLLGRDTPATTAVDEPTADPPMAGDATGGAIDSEAAAEAAEAAEAAAAAAAPLSALTVAGEAGADPRSLFVFLGGALSRLRASDALPSAVRHAYALEASQLCAPLAHSLGVGNTFVELESLSYASLFPQSLRRLRAWYQQLWPDARELLPRLCSTIEDALWQAPSLHGLLGTIDVSGRVKTDTSTFRKLLRERAGGQGVEQVRDVLGVRVVIEPSAAAATRLCALTQHRADQLTNLTAAEAEALVCFGAYRQLLRVCREVPGRFKDFVTHPKPNGYQSLHTTLRLADGRLFEVQIRSAAMHERAERGSAAHNAYRARQLGGGSVGLPALLPAAADSDPERDPDDDDAAGVRDLADRMSELQSADGRHGEACEPARADRTGDAGAVPIGCAGGEATQDTLPASPSH